MSVTCQCGARMERIISAPNFILPVYRHSELVEKKDAGEKGLQESQQHYTEKLNIIDE